MTSETEELKLGKGVAFVKSQLRRLRQDDDVWEVDFLRVPNADVRLPAMWLGMVISRTFEFLLAQSFVERPPTVNDLADLLAHAMRRPLIEFSHRPQAICLRSKPEWTELLPHLSEVGIEVVTQDDLPNWDEAFEEFMQDDADDAASARACAENGNEIDVKEPVLLKVGKAQVAAMFDRQENPHLLIDDSEFLPLLEVVLTAFETEGVERQVVEELWAHAFARYDQDCKNAVPESTTAENQQLMQSYLSGQRRRSLPRTGPR